MIEELTEKYSQKLIVAIRKKINFKECMGGEKRDSYDGFDMSGYGEAHWKNLDLLNRFSDYMQQDNERVCNIFIPHFWKGGGKYI